MKEIIFNIKMGRKEVMNTSSHKMNIERFEVYLDEPGKERVYFKELMHTDEYKEKVDKDILREDLKRNAMKVFEMFYDEIIKPHLN